MKIFKLFFDWSEVWALLIPLATLFFLKRPQPGMKPIMTYLIIALILNLAGDFIADLNRYIPKVMHNNLIFYNIHSIIRFTCFSWFFLQKGKSFNQHLQYAIIGTYIILFIVNFTFFENFFNRDHLSGNLFSVEAFLLLVSCMAHYLGMLKTDTPGLRNIKDFWIVTGISIFFVINFFVFLFYVPMMEEKSSLADWMWNFHNIAYITLCIFIAKAFYVPAGD